MRRAKEDAPPKAPSIEETFDALTAEFLAEVDAASSRHAKSIEADWIGIAPTDRAGVASQVVRRVVSAGFHTPAHAADVHLEGHRWTA